MLNLPCHLSPGYETQAILGIISPIKTLAFLVKTTIINYTIDFQLKPTFLIVFTTTFAQKQKTSPLGELPLDLFAAIQSLKKELNAVILAHYYQEPDIQDIADFIGDSLQLAKAAANTNADVIVFAGVHFMAETAKILNPDKLVLLPDLNAGCSLADSCPPNEFALFKAAHPNHLVISYINCSAEIKAMTILSAPVPML